MLCITVTFTNVKPGRTSAEARPRCGDSGAPRGSANVIDEQKTNRRWRENNPPEQTRQFILTYSKRPAGRRGSVSAERGAQRGTTGISYVTPNTKAVGLEALYLTNYLGLKRIWKAADSGRESYKCSVMGLEWFRERKVYELFLITVSFNRPVNLRMEFESCFFQICDIHRCIQQYLWTFFMTPL